MTRILSATLWSAAFGLLAASAAVAQSQVAVERSGRTYHVAVCRGPAARGFARCHAHLVTDSSGRAITVRRMVTPNITPAPAGYGPADLQAAYNVVHTAPGITGPVVAIVDAYGYPNAESDLAVYRAQYGLPPCTSAGGCFTKLNQSGMQGSYPPTDIGWDEEQALDIEMVSAICPQCRIVLVEATSASFPNLAAAENTAAKLNPIAISNSYGGGELGGLLYGSAWNHKGIAITASSGDGGYAAGPEFPATSPYVTAVGGTSLTPAANARGWTETVWGGAGSGCSAYFSKPKWQNGLNLCKRRLEADVSAVADPATYVAAYAPDQNGVSTWLGFGGTSVSAPIIASMYALNGVRSNYGSDPYSHKGALYDVTTGSNGSCGNTYLCTGAVGYDAPSGLGTPNGSTAF